MNSALMRLRLPADLKEWVKTNAITNCRTMNGEVVALLENRRRSTVNSAKYERADGPNEGSLRRRADRAGYRIIKSRKTHLTTDDRGEYMLIDAQTRLPVLGYAYDADLADIAAFLS